MQTLEVTTGSAEETFELGKRFGALVEAGSVVLLNGNLGAGKTCFAQGVGAGLGVPLSSPVTSPSYTLLNVHQGRIPLYHFDLYRLSVVDDLTDLGYDDYAEGNGLTLVEWADRMSGSLQESIVVTIQRVAEESRTLRMEPRDEKGASLLRKLSAQV